MRPKSIDIMMSPNYEFTWNINIYPKNVVPIPMNPKFFILFDGEPVTIANANLKNVIDIQYKEL